MFFVFSYIIAQAFLSLYAVSSDCVINCYLIGKAIQVDKGYDKGYKNDEYSPSPLLDLVRQLEERKDKAKSTKEKEAKKEEEKKAKKEKEAHKKVEG